MRWAESYITIPYLDRGESHDGCDCWGLLKLIFKEQLGREISSHADVAAGDLMAKARKIIKSSETSDEWEKVDQEKPFDAVLMKGQFRVEGAVRSLPVHIGLVVTPGKLIHIEKKSGVTIAEYHRHPKIKSRVLGFYRLKDV
jgi:cell wall-associated NlpC family hydrolase